MEVPIVGLFVDHANRDGAVGFRVVAARLRKHFPAVHEGRNVASELKFDCAFNVASRADILDLNGGRLDFA